MRKSKILGLSSEQFVGMVTDDPSQKIKLDVFHCEIMNDHNNLKIEADSYKDLPPINRVNMHMGNDNYLQIKKK